MRSAALILIVALLWVVGLLAFADRANRLTTPDEVAPADAVVALTGSSARIAAAMKLLEDGKGARLLISGVNRAASPADIRAVANATQRYYNCCVDLGFEATSTVGNAKETAVWARAHNFHSLIVVTSDFHMPRAMLELHEALPDVVLTPYPVKSSELDASSWWRTPLGARRMTFEYCKYLVILFREGLLSLGPKTQPQPAPVASAS